MSSDDGTVYFAPGIDFPILIRLIEEENKEDIIKAFSTRVDQYYLKQLEHLSEIDPGFENAFSIGLISVALLDYLCHFVSNKKETNRTIYKKFIEDQFDVDPEISHRFYNHFRNGLVHEGRIKHGSYFSFERTSDPIFINEQEYLIVNSFALWVKVTDIFDEYISSLDDVETYRKFIDMLQHCHRDDISIHGGR